MRTYQCLTGLRRKEKCCNSVLIRRCWPNMVAIRPVAVAFVPTIERTAVVVCHAWFARLLFCVGGQLTQPRTDFRRSRLPARRVRTIPWRWPVRYWPPNSGETIRSWVRHFLLLPMPTVNTIGALLSGVWLSWRYCFEEMACCDGFSWPSGSLP